MGSHSNSSSTSLCLVPPWHLTEFVHGFSYSSQSYFQCSFCNIFFSSLFFHSGFPLILTDYGITDYNKDKYRSILLINIFVLSKEKNYVSMPKLCNFSTVKCHSGISLDLYIVLRTVPKLFAVLLL